MSIWTQGTELFVLAPKISDPDDFEVVKIECITGFTPGGDPADQIEDTCLDATARSYIKGLKTPGQATVNLNADPTNDSHVRLYNLFKTNTGNLQWAVGWSDGTVVPTIDSSGDLDLSEDRTWFIFEGEVTDFPFDFAANTVVATAAVIQRSGESDWVVKSSS